MLPASIFGVTRTESSAYESAQLKAEVCHRWASDWVHHKPCLSSRNFERRHCSRSDTSVPTPSCHDAGYVGPAAGGDVLEAISTLGWLTVASLHGDVAEWVCPTAATTVPQVQTGSSCGNRWRYLPAAGRSYLCKLYEKSTSLKTQLGSPRDPGRGCVNEGVPKLKFHSLRSQRVMFSDGKPMRVRRVLWVLC